MIQMAASVYILSFPTNKNSSNRLTPAYAFIMCFIVYIIPQLEGGPFGRGVIWQSACQDHWWTNILYINNYILPDKQCLIPSWYIASDMQLYILCSLLGYVLYKNKKAGLFLLGAVGFLSTLLPGIQVLKGYYNGITLFYLRNFEYYFSNQQFVETYLQTHARASPYIIGMISAYLYYQLKKKKVVLHNVTMWVLFAAMTVVMNGSILGAWVFYIPGRKYELWENILYSTLHKLGWAIPVAFVIITDATNSFAPFRKTVGLKMFQPLNGLTYSALLVHTPFQLFMAGQARAPLYYTSLISVWMGMGDICMTYIIALLLYLFVEGPFAGLQDLIHPIAVITKKKSNIKQRA